MGCASGTPYAPRARFIGAILHPLAPMAAIWWRGRIHWPGARRWREAL